MWESTPIINYVFEWSSEESKVFQDQLMAIHCLHHTKGMKPVEFFKTCLGRQNYTWTGEHRNWVWEGLGWRVYVSNIQGIGLEVMCDLKKEHVQAAWADFRARIDLTDEAVSTMKMRMREMSEKSET